MVWIFKDFQKLQFNKNAMSLYENDGKEDNLLLGILVIVNMMYSEYWGSV